MSQVDSKKTQNTDSSAPKKKYTHICKQCGETFVSTAKNTQFCSECKPIRRQSQISNFIDKRRIRNEQIRRRTYAVTKIDVNDETIFVPLDFMCNAELMLGNEMKLSYGAFRAWSAFHKDDYEIWCKKVALDYKHQCQDLGISSPKRPSEEILANPFKLD